MSSPPSPPPSPYRERISIFSIILWPTRNPAAQEFLTRTPPQAADADDGFVITSFYLQFLSWEHRHRAWNRTGLVVDAPSRETSSLHLVISIESSPSGSLSFPLSFSLSLTLSLHCPNHGRWFSRFVRRWKIGDFTIGSIIDKSPTMWILDERIGFLALLIFILFPSPFFSDLLVVDVSLSIVENNRTCSWHRSWPTGCWYSFAKKFSFARWNNLGGNCFYEIDTSMSFLLWVSADFFFLQRNNICSVLPSSKVSEKDR